MTATLTNQNALHFGRLGKLGTLAPPEKNTENDSGLGTKWKPNLGLSLTILKLE